MFVVTVTLRIDPPQLPLFAALMRTNAATSLAEEPDCLRFDVCTDPSTPDEIFLYEIYRDEGAFKAHLQSKHFKTFDEASADMVISKRIKTYSEVAV
ncbi:putative quinol monooxygenase [Gymnodinialimonas sp. 2305UL16-5]|uniref:putative quinol monooxygenase n=1 Tax=Gymnodinialimonas mytili TaxID=3126503 RepID=UPI0030A6C6F0